MASLVVPDEILSEIFLIVMHSHKANQLSQLSCKAAVTSTYRCLSNMLSVCSTWRRVIMSTTSLWTLIPIINPPIGRTMFTASQAILRRAGGRCLHLVAYLSDERPEIRDFAIGAMSRYASQIGAVNLHSHSAPIINRSIAALAPNTSGSYGSVKELSLCCSKHIDWDKSCNHIVTRGYKSPPLGVEFRCLMEFIRVLRIRGMSVDFKDTSLGMLTELRLQDLALGHKSALSHLLWALRLSSQLHKLELITVVTYHSEWEVSPSFNFPISLPNLQELYLEDLSLDTLKFILESVTPGSHTTTLNWTPRCSVDVYDGFAVIYHNSSLDGLSHFNIDNLLFSRRPGEDFLHEDIYYILQAMPNITSLYLDSLYLNSEVFDALVPSTQTSSEQGSGSGCEEEDYKTQNSDAQGFAQLTKLYISRSHCHDLSALRKLRKVLTSHQIQELGIGIGPDCDCKRHHDRACLGEPTLSQKRMEYSPPPGSGHPRIYDQDSIDLEVEELFSSLESSVPRLLQLSGNAAGRPPVHGFESRIWQL